MSSYDLKPKLNAAAILSIVIPTLNEEENLSRILPELQSLVPAPEIIVSDGGSTDNTLPVAEQSNVKIITGRSGRGPQLNRGPKLCEGEAILFLHADSSLPVESYHMLLMTLQQEPHLDGGALTFSLASTMGGWPRIYEKMVWLRSHILNLPYGDQGFFIRRALWNQDRQYQDWPLMEDVEWWERMCRQLTMKILPCPLVTSARRFKKRGYCISALRNLTTLARFKLGASPNQLARQYDR